MNLTTFFSPSKSKVHDTHILERYYRPYAYFIPPFAIGAECQFVDHKTGKYGQGTILEAQTIWTENQMYVHRYKVSVVDKPYKLYVYELLQDYY